MSLKMKKVISIIMIATMVIAAGCQAVGGLDLNQVLKNMVRVTSAEGTYDFEFKLKLNEDELKQEAIEAGADEEMIEQQLDLLRQYSHVRLVVDNYKAKDQTQLQMSGFFSFGDKEKLGFDVKMSEALAVIKVDGAKKPFSFDLTGKKAEQLQRQYYEELGYDYDEYFGEQNAFAEKLNDKAVTAAIQEMSYLVSDYTIEHLPNIERLSVSTVEEKINGVDTELFTLQGDIKGMELWSWAKKLLDSIVKDREGLEKLISELFTIYEQNEAVFNEISSSFAVEDYLEVSLEEEAATPEEQKKQVVDELINAIEELQLSMTELEQEEEEALKQILNDSLTVSFKYGVDASLNVRKQELQLEYRINEELKEEQGIYGIEGFSITSSSQLWNVNGDVAVAEPDAAFTAAIEELAYMQGFEVAALFEKGSFIDTVLRDQLHITQQAYWTYLDGLQDNGMYLNENNQAMIPVRDVMEQFGGNIIYKHDEKKVVLYDRATLTRIELQIGSNKANINGAEVEWSAPVVTRNGYLFAPARSLADALGAEVEWYNPGFIYIKREP